MKNRLQPIYDIAALCAARNIHQAILCPGSRNAPLILAFSRHPDIHCKSITDERSAAFIALGIGQQLKRPAVVVSTSGSAAFNFAPAVSEAYFARIPLLIFTADRPTEWVGQQDGQTIIQHNIFGSHVKRSYQLPQEYDHHDNQWAINRMVNEAISLSQEFPSGPVHINVPLREPLYPGDHQTGYSENIRVINELRPTYEGDNSIIAEVKEKWSAARSVLFVAGQQADDDLRSSVSQVCRRLNVPLIGDVLSNFHTEAETIRYADLILGSASPAVLESLRPELLVTFGESSISKNLKSFLRTHKPKWHWHVQQAGDIADTFQSITTVLRMSPRSFFNSLADLSFPPSFDIRVQDTFCKRWRHAEKTTSQSLDRFYPQAKLGEAEVVFSVLRNLPATCNVHLANSMSVRYATQAGLLAHQKGVHVYANRGTSGIDGCNSTAVGHALVSDVPNVLITGDLAFFYDRNAFWHNYRIPNLHILLLNNHGGGIFKMIDGPGNIPELDDFLVTKQSLTARKLCEEFSFDYSQLDSRENLDSTVRHLLQPSGCTRLLEFNSEVETNKHILHSLKRHIKDSYEQ